VAVIQVAAVWVVVRVAPFLVVVMWVAAGSSCVSGCYVVGCCLVGCVAAPV